MTHWLSPPPVSAPSGKDRTKTVHYSISPEFFEKNAVVGKKTPIFQIWAHVIGELPPINNIGYLNRFDVRPTISTLNDSIACFEGVNRPYDLEDNGHSILTYVLNPMASIQYEPDMVCLAKAVRLAPDLTATVQVKLTEPLHLEAITICGMVTRIEFVHGEPAEGGMHLPIGHAERYRQRLW